MNQVKTCKTCSQSKELSHFSTGKAVCKPCRATCRREKYIIEKQIKQNKQTELNQINESDHVYLLTSESLSGIKRYKIGKHRGTIEMLENRYKTYFPDFIILRFWKIDNALFHECSLHNSLDNFRVGKSEWFDVPDERSILTVFDRYRNNIEKNNITAKISDEMKPLYKLSIELQKHMENDDRKRISDIFTNMFAYIIDNFDNSIELQGNLLDIMESD